MSTKHTGYVPQDSNLAGYRHCHCPDCFEIAIGTYGTFCTDCKDARCDGSGECCSPYAYGDGYDDCNTTHTVGG